MDLKHNRNRKYKGRWVSKGDPVESYTQDQADRMVVCGQAYWEVSPSIPEPELPTMSNTKKEIELYLDENGIEYDEFATKSELLELI